MNQLDLILENIRLGHIEHLMQEAQSDLEVIRGQRLINESIMQLRGALLQEFDASMVVPEDEPLIDPATGALVAGGLGAAAYRYGGAGLGAVRRAADGFGGYKEMGGFSGAMPYAKAGMETRFQNDVDAVKAEAAAAAAAAKNAGASVVDAGKAFYNRMQPRAHTVPSGLIRR